MAGINVNAEAMEVNIREESLRVLRLVCEA